MIWINPTTVLLLLGLLTIPESNQRIMSPGTIVFPESRAVVVNIATISISGEYDTSRVGSIAFLKSYTVEKDIQITRESQKRGFAKELFDMFPEGFILGRIEFRSNYDNLGYRYRPVDLINIERFWASTDLKRIWRMVHNKKARTSNIRLQGWTMAGFESTDEIRASMGNIFAVSIPLLPGLNEFKVLYLDRKGATIAEDSIGVFYTIPTLEDSPPDEYEGAVFHTSDVLQRCVTCHADDPDAEEPELECTSCHQNLGNLTSYHPAAEDCTLCHDMSSEEEFKLIEDQSMDSEFCFMCHSDKQEAVESAEFGHAAVYDCAVCHDQHGTSYGSLLRDRTKNLCFSCHPDQEGRNHPAANHPFEAPDEKNRPGVPLSCSSCHDPHGSPYQKLVRFEKRPICINCHT